VTPNVTHHGTRSWATRAIVVLAVLGLALAACGGSSGTKSTKSGGSTKSNGKALSGGTVTIAAEQELDCADWIASCAGSSWGTWTLGAQTLPRTFEQVGGKYLPSVLLAGEPTLKAGPPQVVTYKINPKAVWSDGQPITAHDFKYTWDQIANGSDIYDRTNYKNIESIDDSKPDTPVVTFKADQSDAAWRDLFGGFYGVLPSHLLEGKDRSALMKDGYDWSGGPWIGKWNKGTDITLTPNPKWWGDKPKLDKVVFKFTTDTAAEAQAYKTGQVVAAYPQPQIESAELKTAPDTSFVVSVKTTSLEGIWMNAQHFPFDSKAVRQAIAYSLDRQAIVKQLFGPLDPTIKASQSLNFDFGAPSAGYYRPTFDKYHKDLKMVDKLMTGDGWKKGSDGIWAKGGKPASFKLATTTGNHRRDLTEQLLQSELKDAGFQVQSPFDNAKSGTLFGDKLPKGDFDAGIYAEVATLDPGLCLLFCSENIPSEANGNSGQNWTRLASAALDKPWKAADVTLDESKRNSLIQEGEKVLADEVPAIPIDPLPNIVVWNNKALGGPIGDNPTYGMFWNINKWYRTG
jgi:peptide/nickel transport system substrate-binding protein